MLDADRYPSRHGLQSNSSHNKKLFSDIAIGAFRFHRRSALKWCTGGPGGSLTGPSGMSDAMDRHPVPLTAPPPPPPAEHPVAEGGGVDPRHITPAISGGLQSEERGMRDVILLRAPLAKSDQSPAKASDL